MRRAAVPLVVGLLAALCGVAGAGDDPTPFGPPVGPPSGGRPPVGPAAPGASPLSPPPPASAPPGRTGDPALVPPPVAAFSPWLAHADWLCRALAASELSRRADEGTVRLLTRALEREREAKVVAVLVRGLAGRLRESLLLEGGVALCDRTIPLLKDPHPLVRARALEILRTLAPVRLGDRPDDYLVWWTKGRDGLALEATLLAERRAAERASAPRPNDTVTVAPGAFRRYADLERIRRHGLELVLCLDSTGSMIGVIDAAKRDLRALVERLRGFAPKVRVGLVTYDDASRVRTGLTTDAGELDAELRRVVAEGGDDYEEGVDKAILVALRQDKVGWSGKAMRVVVVVGDAPPHPEDVAGLLRAIAKARKDPTFEEPVRIDTLSTNPARTGDAEGLVPWFQAIAAAGGGTALRLHQAKDLAAELVAAAFGPTWREALGTLFDELDAYDAARPQGR